MQTDDTHVRFDYAPTEARYHGITQKGFAQIKRMFVHEAYPGGPARVVVEGDWMKFVDLFRIAKTTLVRKTPDHPFNLSSRYVFLGDWYHRPVTICPHDPFGKLQDAFRDCFDIIDRNQDEDYE